MAKILLIDFRMDNWLKSRGSDSPWHIFLRQSLYSYNPKPIISKSVNVVKSSSHIILLYSICLNYSHTIYMYVHSQKIHADPHCTCICIPLKFNEINSHLEQSYEESFTVLSSEIWKLYFTEDENCRINVHVK